MCLILASVGGGLPNNCTNAGSSDGLRARDRGSIRFGGLAAAPPSLTVIANLLAVLTVACATFEVGQAYAQAPEIVATVPGAPRTTPSRR